MPLESTAVGQTRKIRTQPKGNFPIVKLDNHFSPHSYALLKFTEEDSFNETAQQWADKNDIMNHPYFREDMQRLRTTADKSYLENSGYYPSPNDKVYKGLPVLTHGDQISSHFCPN